jgi:hypothetical protein
MSCRVVPKGVGAGLTFLLPLSLVQALAAGEKVELLERARAGHASTFGAIHSLACTLSVRDEPPSSFRENKIVYYQNRQHIRGHVESKDAKEDFMIDARTYSGFFTRARPDTSGQISLTKQVRLSWEPWRFALFKFRPLPADDLTFEDLLAKPYKLHGAERIGKLIHVHIACQVSEKDNREFEFWFDPDVNYLVRKHILRGPNFEIDVKVERFTEPRQGVFFPALVRAEHRNEGKVVHAETAVFSNVRINESLPADAFRFQFPPGILVYDHIKNELHKTDANGNPILPPIDKQGQQLSLVNVAHDNEEPETKIRQVTQEEPRNWTRWLLPISLALLVVAVSLFVIQKARVRRRSTELNKL